MAICPKLKEYLLERIEDFQATERTDAEGDLPSKDVVDTLADIIDEFRR